MLVARTAAASGTLTADTPIAHVIYLNDCLPDGCRVSPGNDDVQAGTSTLPQALSTIPGYSWGTDSWNALVACVQATYAPFDIQVVTVDPGAANHFEVLIGGNPSDIQLGADSTYVGVAPFIPCGVSEMKDNVYSFIFAAQTSDLNLLCGAVVQESAHVFGLDHELDAADVMTYLDLGSAKIFDDKSASCGETTPRTCHCGGTQQNSYQYMIDTFGASMPMTSTLAITSPTNGETVAPGFAVDATLTSQSSLFYAKLSIDGVVIAGVENDPITFPTSKTLPDGPHTISLTALNLAGETLTSTADVTVGVVPPKASGCCSTSNDDSPSATWLLLSLFFAARFFRRR